MLLAPVVDTVDREANLYTQGNRPLTKLESDGVLYIRGVKYTLDPSGYIGGGGRSSVWKATRDASAPLHDVRSSLVRGGTIDRVCPRLNDPVVAVKILRCFNLPGDEGSNAGSIELMRAELDMTTGSGTPIFAFADDKAARCELQMHARAQHYSAAAGSTGVIQLLAATSTSHPVQVNEKWIKLPTSEQTTACACGFVIFVVEFAHLRSLQTLVRESSVNTDTSKSLYYQTRDGASAAGQLSVMSESLTGLKETAKQMGLTIDDVATYGSRTRKQTYRMAIAAAREAATSAPRPPSMFPPMLCRQTTEGGGQIDKRDERCVKWIAQSKCCYAAGRSRLSCVLPTGCTTALLAAQQSRVDTPSGGVPSRPSDPAVSSPLAVQLYCSLATQRRRRLYRLPPHTCTLPPPSLPPRSVRIHSRYRRPNEASDTAAHTRSDSRRYFAQKCYDRR